jgi:hypothetical protein
MKKRREALIALYKKRKRARAKKCDTATSVPDKLTLEVPEIPDAYPNEPVVYVLFNSHGGGTVSNVTTSLNRANVWRAAEPSYRQVIEAPLNIVRDGLDHFGPPKNMKKPHAVLTRDILVLLNKHGARSIQGVVEDRVIAEKWRRGDELYREAVVIAYKVDEEWDDITQ